MEKISEFMENNPELIEKSNYSKKSMIYTEFYNFPMFSSLPSEQESFGLAALEAMAARTPVISSNAGGISK